MIVKVKAWAFTPIVMQEYTHLTTLLNAKQMHSSMWAPPCPKTMAALFKLLLFLFIWVQGDWETHQATNKSGQNPIQVDFVGVVKRCVLSPFCFLLLYSSSRGQGGVSKDSWVINLIAQISFISNNPKHIWVWWQSSTCTSKGNYFKKWKMMKIDFLQ